MFKSVFIIMIHHFIFHGFGNLMFGTFCDLQFLRRPHYCCNCASCLERTQNLLLGSERYLPKLSCGYECKTFKNLVCQCPKILISGSSYQMFSCRTLMPLCTSQKHPRPMPTSAFPSFTHTSMTTLFHQEAVSLTPWLMF